MRNEIRSNSLSLFKKPSAIIFSVLLAVSVVLGSHLHITSAYDGLITENYITPYTAKDAAVFIGVICAAYFVLCVLNSAAALYRIEIEYKPVKCRIMLPHILCLFLLWLPYLLAYWPGFFFPDTENSVQQALGIIAYNNRNPLLFTLFIKLCIFIGNGFNSRDITCALAVFSVIQMLFLAGCISYALIWLRENTSLRKIYIYISFLIFGITPYIAETSIAAWKDPVFSGALVLLSISMLELAATEGRCIENRRWRLGFYFRLLLTVFWRNNGFTAVIFCLAGILLLIKSKNRFYKKAFIILLAVLLLWSIIEVPVFKLFGIGTPKEESAGLMLNQMARVAACEGQINDEEREFLNELLPFEKYKEKYRPCCVDMLKWDDEFNYSALSGSRFIKTWLSLMVKNPRLYFEAWEMETYGFWTINRAEINLNTANISFGSPRNLTSEVYNIQDYTLRMQNLLPDGSRAYLKTDGWFVPLGIINWMLAAILVVLLLSGRGKLCLALLPVLGTNVFTIIGTPIWYLPRYGFASQLMLPIYLALLFAAGSGKRT